MMDYFENIDDYINDSLSEEMKQSFVKELATNPDLQLAVEQHAGTQEVLDYLLEEDIQTSIDKVKSEIKRKPGNLHIATKRKSLFTPLRIAASLLLLVSASWFIFNQDNTSDQIDVMDYYEMPVNKSPRGITNKTDLELAHEAFDKRDFEQAENLFNKILLSGKNKTEATEYLGHISLIQEDFKKALNYFTNIESNAQRKNIIYFEVLSHVGLNDIEKAKSILETIERQENSKADLLFKRLQNL